MWTEDHVAKLLAAIFDNDVARIAPMVAEHVVWRTPRSAPLTHRGAKIGREAALAMLAGGANSPYVPGSKRPSVELVVIEEGLVFARYRMRSQLKSGGAYDNEYCLVLRLEDGLIAETWEHVDSANFYALLGVDPVWLRDLGPVDPPAGPILSKAPNAEAAVAFLRTLYAGDRTADISWRRPPSQQTCAASLAPGTTHPVFEFSAASGDLAAVQLRLRARLDDGRAYDNHYGYMFRLRAGRIIDAWEHFDTAILAAAG